ncbi:leukocyte elastase inhibitor-like [Ochlerotatus camptorhynchus]|uniref:leukocyte elastase inhibitor-like n=1 Tax=Ochlerotatus camptorhynchus TaxID=644619 RepID=UPI0031D11ABE
MKFVYCLTLVLITSELSYGMSSFTKASVKFTLNFFRTAYNMDSSKNCVFSPIAIQRLFTMLHHAARDDVSSQMETLLGLPKNLQSLQNGLNNHALEMITKVYHSQVELEPHLLPVLQTEHEVDVQALDFSRQEPIVRVVNNWASRFTNGIVKNVFSTQGLADDANLVMVNTLTLSASWENQFNPFFTTQRSFNFINGAREVDMMRTTDYCRFAEINDLQIVEVFFQKDTNLSMLFIRSKSRPLENVIEKFDLYTYRLIDERLSFRHLELEIPKFSISTGLEVKLVLDALGLGAIFSKDAFEVFADFTSQLSNVYQILRVDINETGTRAAAGTRKVMLMGKRAYPRFAVNGPFMFLIRKTSSKDIIFIGHYSRRDE